MPFQPLLKEPPKGIKRTKGQSQAALFPEKHLPLQWAKDNPEASWIDYRCWVEVLHDPGMVLHKPLPQAPQKVDDIGLLDINAPNWDTFVPPNGGVNISSLAQGTDVIQRMATSTYTFILRGWGLRVGFQIPLPILKSVAGVPATPRYPQWGYNVMVGNCAGVPVWFATWQKWYMIVKPATSATAEAPVPSNPALHIRPDAELVKSIALPLTQPDQANTPGSVLRTGGIPAFRPRR